MSARPSDKYRWVVAIEVSPVWVADGFDLTPARLRDIALGKILPWARPEEVATEVIEAPDSRAIRREQGYADEGPQRVPCRCGDGSCMECDDDGMVPT